MPHRRRCSTRARIATVMAVVDVTKDGKPEPASTTDPPSSMPGM